MAYNESGCIFTDRIKTLLKFQIRYKLGLRHIKEIIASSKYMRIPAAAAAVFLLFIAACILAPYTFLMNFLYGEFEKAGDISKYLSAMFVLCNAVTFIASLFSVYSVLFTDRDREILTPLPIKKHHIFLVNYIVLYLSSLFASFVFLLPGFAVYIVRNGFFPILPVKIIISAAFFPALPLALAFILMSVVLRFISRFRNKEIFATIGGAVLICMCLYISNSSVSLSNIFLSEDGLFFHSGKILFNSYFCTKFLMSNGIESLFYICVNIISALVLTLLIYIYGGAIYNTICEKLTASVSESASKKKNLKQSRQQDALCMKEIKTILRSPVYAINCLINIVFAPLAAIMISAKRDVILDKITSVLYLKNTDTGFFYAMIGIYIAFLLMSLSMVPSTSVSREGKMFWLMRVIPVDIKTQIIGRAKAAVTLYSICGFLFIFLFGILLKINFLYIIYGIGVIFAGSIPFALAGLYIDVSNPKLIWDKETEAVKQNLNGMLGIFVSIVFSLIYMTPFVLYILGKLGKTAVIAAIPVCIVLCILLSIYILKRKIKTKGDI